MITLTILTIVSLVIIALAIVVGLVCGIIAIDLMVFMLIVKGIRKLFTKKKRVSSSEALAFQY